MFFLFNCRYNEAEKVGDVNHGDINIRVMTGYRKEGFITSHLLIQKRGSAPRKCIHYWFDSWPDHGVPALSEPAVAMIEAVRTVRQPPSPPLYCAVRGIIQPCGLDRRYAGTA